MIRDRERTRARARARERERPSAFVVEYRHRDHATRLCRSKSPFRSPSRSTLSSRGGGARARGRWSGLGRLATSRDSRERVPERWTTDRPTDRSLAVVDRASSLSATVEALGMGGGFDESFPKDVSAIAGFRRRTHARCGGATSTSRVHDRQNGRTHRPLTTERWNDGTMNERTIGWHFRAFGRTRESRIAIVRVRRARHHPSARE